MITIMIIRLLMDEVSGGKGWRRQGRIFLAGASGEGGFVIGRSSRRDG
jgi:hypothetical protein